LTLQPHETIENTLDLLLRALKNYQHEALDPYEKFKVGAKTYCFSPGGSLYRTDPELNKEDVASVFSGYLSDELNLRR
jgi:hypothetical protein